MSMAYTPDLDNSSENLNIRRNLIAFQQIEGNPKYAVMETDSEDMTDEDQPMQDPTEVILNQSISEHQSV